MWHERVRGKKELRQGDGDEYEMGVRVLQKEMWFVFSRSDLLLLPHTHLRNRDIFLARVCVHLQYVSV